MNGTAYRRQSAIAWERYDFEDRIVREMMYELARRVRWSGNLVARYRRPAWETLVGCYDLREETQCR